MQLSEIRSEVQYRSGDNTLSQTNIDRWVNASIKQWAARADWPSIIDVDTSNTTVSGTSEYTLPLNFKKMLGVRVGASSSSSDADSSEYSYVEYKNKNVSTTGNFYYLNPENATIGLIPTPTTTGLPIYIKYFKVPADISLATDVPPFNENYHELVVFFALKKYAESIDEFDKALYYNAEFENMIERMKSEVFTRSSGSLPRMRDYREVMADNQPQMLNGVELGK